MRAFNMAEKFEDMCDNELGTIIKEFMDCDGYKDCGCCACEGVLCGVYNIDEARKAFIEELTKRVME